MAGLILHTGNQLDRLAKRLSEVVSRPLASPFTPEIVVVQSLASRRWLSFQIAQHQGICANYVFPFLGDFVDWLVKEGSPAEALIEKISPEHLAWKIDSLLPECLARKEFAPVAKYLRDGDSLKRFHLATRLANLFDQYRVYRPEMVSDWARSKKTRSGHEGWQAALWREVAEAPGFDKALERLRNHGFDEPGQLNLSERISIFAPASVPPAYLDLIFQLARVREIHLFLLRPSREYRGNDPTPKQRARLGLRTSDAGAGNPLATSWGKIDADLTDLLIEKEERLGISVTSGSEEFRNFKSDTLLGILKNDIVNAENRGGGDSNDPAAIGRLKVKPGDRSITLHSCYSPMREVEVLHDQLLNCFATIPGLRPRDILVVTPEIEKYAPFIRAVFEYPENESMRIPYSVADRHPRSESQPIDTFLTLLDFPGSRYTASQIFGLLGSRALRRRFRFNDENLSLIRNWIEETAIRWGIDGNHRKRLGLPGLDTNTWRHGLRRLLLGYAMEGQNKILFEGVLAHDEVEGDGAEVLGRFVTAAEELFQLTESLERSRPLAHWIEPFTKLIDQFLDPSVEEEVRDVRFLRLIVDQLRVLRDKTDTDEEVDFRVVRDHLARQVATMEQRGNFFVGKVTFCAIKPVRGIPARVVCLLGINDQAFPRRPQPAQFDLMARTPRSGDPSARQDDRYSFLETLLSAEEKLLISYVGRSTVHNQQVPPSVVVSELLDYLNQAFVFPGNKSSREFLLTEHPLQAFSPRYFASPAEDDRLFAYSEANAKASGAITTPSTLEVRPFIAGPLPQVDEPVLDLELRELIAFWRNPSQHFVKRRLGLNLWDSSFCLDDEEPFQPGPLELYPIKQELLAEELEAGSTLPFEIFEARGLLPSGTVGELRLGSIQIEIQNLAGAVRKVIAGGKGPAASIDLTLGKYTLSGKISNLYGGQNVHFRPAKLSAKDYLRAWIEHLALCLQNRDDKPTPTILIGRDAVVTFGPISSAQDELRTLCDLYLEGLAQPLRFFPISSMTFAEATLSGQGDPIKKAREKWDPYDRKGKREGEKDNPYFERCFDAATPFKDPFAELALRVFKTILESQERREL